MAMPVARKMRFGGLNVLLHWAAYLIIADHDGDRDLALSRPRRLAGPGPLLHGLRRPLLHLRPHVAHYLYGGWWQVFRVFRPAKLVLTQAVKPKPLLIAAGVGVVVDGGGRRRPTGPTRDT